MDSGEFDKIIKKNLGNYSQLPKREVKRAVFGFLFFQNLWVFHKLKLFSVLSIAIGLSLGLLLQNDDKNIQDFSELDFENNQKPLLKSLNEPFFSNGSENREIISAKNNDPLNSGKSIANNELIPPLLNLKNSLDFIRNLTFGVKPMRPNNTFLNLFFHILPSGCRIWGGQKQVFPVTFLVIPTARDKIGLRM